MRMPLPVLKGPTRSWSTSSSWAAAASPVRLWTTRRGPPSSGETVTPRFPDGLTVLDAQGQWRDSDGLIQQERSKLLVILAPPDGDAMRLIDEVSDEYKRRFNQESVLRVVEDTCVSFS